MKIIKNSTTPNGTKINLVDWSEDYSCYAYSAHIHAYPIAKETNYDSVFCYPEKGKKFLLQFDFDNEEAAEKAFELLERGEAELKHFSQFVKEKKYLNLI